MERWLPVVGYEGLYEVSDHGRVRSLDRVVERRSGRGPNVRFPQRYAGRMLRPGIASHGYPTVSLNGRGKRRSACLHDLVLTAFVGPCPTGMECRHGDGVQTNPALSNLSWGTRKQNAEDRAAHGTQVVGERYPAAKLTATAAREILKQRGLTSQADLANRFGVSPSTVQAVHDGRTWKHVTEEQAA